MFSTKTFRYFLIISILTLLPGVVFAQMTDSVFVVYGSPSGMYVNINERVEINVALKCQYGGYVGDALICLGTDNRYIDSLLSVEEGELFYPFTEWDDAGFLPPEGSPPNPEGWSNQSFIGFAQLNPQSEAPWFYSLAYTVGMKFMLKTVNDSSLIGDDVMAIGPGLNYPQGPTNIGDTLGYAGFFPVETFAMFHFLGGGYVEGIASDLNSGVPIENVCITDSRWGKTDTTDTDGFFHLGLTVGEHNLTYSHTHYLDTTITVNIIENETVVLETMFLSQAGGINGNVYDSDTQPVENAVIQLNTGASDTTNADGFYEFPGLESETYSITTHHPDYVDTEATNIIVEPNQTTTQDFVILRLGVFTGYIKDTHNQPITGALVAFDGNEYTTGGNGAFAFDHIQPNTYDVSITHNDYVPALVSINIPADDPLDTTIVLSQYGNILGIVTDCDTDTRIEGVVVSINTDPVRIDTTSNAGGYRFMSLENGIYTITFEHHDYFTDSLTGIETAYDSSSHAPICLDHRLSYFEGFVYDDSTLVPIDSVNIYIVDAEQEGYSDANGAFYFAIIQEGSFSVRFSHGNYEDTTIFIELTYGDTTSTDVYLRWDYDNIDDGFAKIPEDYFINQNYPNPFNASTTINYGLPKDAFVIIDVYNLLGRKVETLINGNMPAGYHQTIWTANNETSGLYFYRIQADNFTERKSMMLLK